MKLTIEDNPESVRRYGHIERARGSAGERCAATCPGTPRSCTRPRGHLGPHVAHGRFWKVVAVWSSEVEAPGPKVPRRKPPPDTVRWVETRTPLKVLEDAWRLLTSAFSSVETVAFVVLFVAFVAFAVQWLWLIVSAGR